MPFVDVSAQQDDQTKDKDQKEQNNADIKESVVNTPVAPIAQDNKQDNQQQNKQDNKQVSDNAVKQPLPVPSDVNANSISEETTLQTGMQDISDYSAKTGVELDIQSDGVKSMRGPVLPAKDTSLNPSRKSPSLAAQNESKQPTAAPPLSEDINTASQLDPLEDILPSPEPQSGPGQKQKPQPGQANGPAAPEVASTDSPQIPQAPEATQSMQPAQSTQPMQADQSMQSAPATPSPDATQNLTQEGQSSAASLAEENAQDLLPADTTMATLTNLAQEHNASDIHFAANYPVFLRKDSVLYPVTKTINAEQAKILAESLLVVEEKRQKFEKAKEVDFSFTNEAGIRFRVNIFTEKGNPAGALRLIATKIRTIKELDLPEVFFDLIKEPHGLILLVGPTGSGKSTTIAALINNINLDRREHIVTVEDPIEYVYPVGKSVVNQRELEADTMTWKAALKSVLREDPNIVLVGEMRDLDTIASTITIAETGHLVFATLHTNSASQAIDRIIDVFPEGSKDQIRAQLANVITAVISQRLIPIKGGGRKAAIEIMLGTDAVKNAIREAKTYQIDNIIQTSGDLGMLSLEKSLVEMVQQSLITKEQAKEASVKPDDIESLLSKV
jgi:twitching motility protein PilT